MILSITRFFPFFVGMTRLERATPWSQTKYTTNCTTSRKPSFLKSAAKLVQGERKTKFLFEFFRTEA